MLVILRPRLSLGLYPSNSQRVLETAHPSIMEGHPGNLFRLTMDRDPPLGVSFVSFGLIKCPMSGQVL